MIHSAKKIAALIPAYNEAKSIVKVIQDLKKHSIEVLVANDASIDNTAKLALEAGAQVINHKIDHERNQGYDAALNTGFQEAAQQGFDILFSFDADGQHEAQDIPNLLEIFQEQNLDILVGKRSKHARWMEKKFAQWSQKTIGISDPLSGLKVYRLSVYRKIGFFDSLQSTGTEFLFRAAAAGAKIAEAAIQINARQDAPRFGNLIKANYRIYRSYQKIKKLWKKISK